MKIAHVADTHLGYRSSTIGGRSEDFARSWITACRQIVESKPDIVVHAGDVFHRPNPSWSAIMDFLEGANILQSVGVPIFMISGNHDSSRLRLKHTVFSVIEKAVPFITVSYESVPIIHGMPEATVVLLSHQALLNPKLRDSLLTVQDEIDWTKFTILVSHGDIGDVDSSNEKGSVVIPKEFFDFPWSYVALGHLHIAQPFGMNGWYSGSIERCGWSDYPASPGWTLTTLSDTNPIQHVQRSLPHMPMIHLPKMTCLGLQEIDIFEEIMSKLDSVVIPDERADLRIQLDNVTWSMRRSIQLSVQKAMRIRYPKAVLQIKAESSSSILDIFKYDSDREKVQTVTEMFRDFVDARSWEDPTFGPRFLARGLSDLEKVRAAELQGDSDYD